MDGLACPPTTTIVPVDCAGAVTAAAILKAFARKADGVLVAACGKGDCHYTNGNESCERVVEETREVMELAGLSPRRLRLDLSSDVDGEHFVKLLEGFTAEVAKLNGRARRARPHPGATRKTKARAKTRRPAKPRPGTKAKKSVKAKPGAKAKRAVGGRRGTPAKKAVKAKTRAKAKKTTKPRPSPASTKAAGTTERVARGKPAKKKPASRARSGRKK
jgi:coenzyme F420-reducing hydrogenase delta subunit